MGIEDDLYRTQEKLSDLKEVTVALLASIDEPTLARLLKMNRPSDLLADVINLRSGDTLRCLWSGWERAVSKPAVGWGSYTEWTKATDGPGVDLVRRLNELGAGLDEP